MNLFDKAVKAIKDCDVTMTNEYGEVTETGMAISDEVFFTYSLKDKKIRVYTEDRAIEFDKDSLVLYAFDQLLEQIHLTEKGDTF